MDDNRIFPDAIGREIRLRIISVEAESADGHRSGAIKLLICGICDSSQIHRMIVSAVDVIKKLFPT